MDQDPRKDYRSARFGGVEVVSRDVQDFVFRV